MNLQRLALTSLSLFTLAVRTGSICQGAALAHLAIGAASRVAMLAEAAIQPHLHSMIPSSSSAPRAVILREVAGPTHTMRHRREG